MPWTDVPFPPPVSFLNKLSRLSPARLARGAMTSVPDAEAPSGVPAVVDEQAATRAEALAPPAGASASVDDRAQTLEALRTRMQQVLERTARKGPPPPPRVDADDLPFVSSTTPNGPLHVRTLRLSAAHRTGHASLLPSRTASSELLALLALDPSLADRSPARALYLDTETTGLNGGTGTVAFLVGLAWWDADAGGLTVEQILVRNLGEEAPMLAHVAERIRACEMLVTFNGKSFDMPLLRTRFVMARIDAPMEPPHLDLVHVARRLHKARGVECKLTTIERRILGFERHDDVPSGEVSACYLHFLRTGDARSLLGVIEHNAWDVVAMAALVGLYGEPLGGSQLHADDLVGVARTLKRAGKIDDAFEVASAAIDRGAGAESFRARGEIAKARGDRAQALADFERLASSVDDGKARLELVKLYEHYVKEPARALEVLQQGTSEGPEMVAKRHARLSRKAARATQTQLPGLSLLALDAALGARPAQMGAKARKARAR